MNGQLKRIRFFSVLALGIVCAGPAARADVRNFDNSCGDNLWNTCCGPDAGTKSNNWDIDAPPAPICPEKPNGADDVFISLDCEIEPAMTGTVGNMTQTAGTFTINGALTIANLATFDGPVVWNSGSIGREGGAAGQQAICNGGLTIQGDDPKTLSVFGGFTLTNAANGMWSGAGDWTIGMIPGACCPAILENSTGALFDVQTDADILQTASGLGLIQNDGTLRKSASNGVSDWKVSLINDGLVEVQSGELRLTGDGEATGEFNVSAGATLSFATVFFFEFKQGVSFTGPGDAVLVDTGSNFGILVNEAIDLNRFRVANSGSIGPVSNFGSINVTELLQLDGADIRPPVTIAPGATLEHIGPNQSVVGDLFVEGHVDIQQGKLATFNKVVTVQPGGVVEIRDGATLATVGLVNQPIQNNGTIQKTMGAGTAFVESAFFELFFNNAGGLIHVATGTLDFLDTNIRNEGGDWQIDEGATAFVPGSFGQLFELNSGTVRGGGTLVVNRLNNNGGTVAPGDSLGILTIASSVTPARPGNYQQSAGGTLSIEIGGFNAGSQHDQLAVAGTASLDGTLELKQVNGLVPADGDTATILTAASVTGGFSNVVMTGFPNFISAAVQVNATNVVVTFSNTFRAIPILPAPGPAAPTPTPATTGNPGVQTAAAAAGICGVGAMQVLPVMLVGWGVSVRRSKARRGAKA